jgi:hypothetical protein
MYEFNELPVAVLVVCENKTIYLLIDVWLQRGGEGENSVI